jgi:DNA polymerase-3 subunit alpha
MEIMKHEYFKEAGDWPVHEKRIAEQVYKMSKEMQIKAVCTQDAHYATKDLWEAQDVLVSIQTTTSIKNPKRMSMHSKDFFLKSPKEMALVFSKAPQLLKNTVEISEKIEPELIVPDEDLLPIVERPIEIASDEDWLRELVKKRMGEKTTLVNGVKTPLNEIDEYKERANYEMSVLLKCGYVRYFLVLYDMINYANSVGIRVGAGRGSAVSSLILYVLDIVKLDPIEHGLIFERFLNPDRISPPDVDLDFDYNRRGEIHQYLANKYGEECCCQIGTFNSLKAKGAIRDTTKALDLGGDWDDWEKQKEDNPNLKKPLTTKSLEFSDKIAKTMVDPDPSKRKNNQQLTIDETVEKYEAFKDYMDKYPKLYEHAKNMEGTLKSCGTHASGLIVCKEPVADHIPLMLTKGSINSQYDGPEVEELGLLKFDILGLKTLTVIEDTVQLIKKRTGEFIDVDALIPNETKVFDLFNGGYKGGTEEITGKKLIKMDTRGIFQFESFGMQRLLKDISVDKFNDLVIATALYRPGPMGAKMDQMYCEFKRATKAGKEIPYLHPKMGEVLNEDYGIMVFQESVMKISQVMAGFTGGQADTLRKAVGKKKPELLKQQKDLFVTGCLNNGIDKIIAEKVFEQINYFAGYGFNKSHSAAYSFVSYQTAYLKVNYPLEFMCNLLTSEIDNNDKNKKLYSYVEEARNMHIAVKSQNINRSGLSFKIEKGRNANTGLRKTEGRVINKTVMEALVEHGCFPREWGSDEKIRAEYPEVKKIFEKERKALKKEKEKMDEYEGSLFEDFDFSGESYDI